MSPIKIDLITRVMHKTTIPRETNPKITLERLKILGDSNEFVMHKAYE